MTTNIVKADTINTDALYEAQQRTGNRRLNYDYFKDHEAVSKHTGAAPKLDFNMNYLKQKGHQLGYNRKYFDPAAAKAMAYRNNWQYGNEDIDGDDIPDIYATDADNNLMMFNGAFASKLDKPDHRTNVVNYYKDYDRDKRRQTDFTDYLVEKGKKTPKTAKQKLTNLFRKSILEIIKNTPFATKPFNDLAFMTLTHATFAGLEDKRLSDKKSKLFATKGGKAMLEQTYQVIFTDITKQLAIKTLLQNYLGYLQGDKKTDQQMFAEMMKVAKTINPKPISYNEWSEFLTQVEAMKKAKREMKLGQLMEGYDLERQDGD